MNIKSLFFFPFIGKIFPDIYGTVITLENVTKSFGNKIAVKNLSITVKKGEVYGFLGPNGAGKTTTMKMILGLLYPDKGNISLFHEKAGTLDARKKIGFLPEFAHFYQHLSGREFLHFIGEIFLLPKNSIEKRTRYLLKLVNLPSEAYDRQIGTYSKGMQQRIGMAQALMNDPQILFLDEPMSGLDPIGRREMKEIILAMKKEEKTIFFNSHILSDAEEICDRIGIIHLGQLLLDGSVSDVVPKGKTLEDVFIEVVTGKKIPLKSKKSVQKKKETSKSGKAKKVLTEKKSTQKKTAKKITPKKTPPKPPLKKKSKKSVVKKSS